MRDLTHGSLLQHLIRLAAPIAIGMLVQTLYLLVDLYFVARLGQPALAGVSAAGNLMFVMLALSQMLGVGTLSMMARAIGAQDQARARLVFNQALGLAAGLTVLTLTLGYDAAPAYLRTIGAEPAAAAQGIVYLYWYLPGLALQFALSVLGAAMRADGVAAPAMLAQLLSVLVNTVLAPVLIGGWQGRPGLGVAGAGLASSLSIAIGLIVLGWLMHRQRRRRLDCRLIVPRWSVCRQLLAIGFPAGMEFACLFILLGVIYAVISPFGAAAMAGFGVGARLLQALFLPAMAIAFAVPAIVAQNLGAGKLARVAATLRLALWLESLLMLGLMLASWGIPQSWIGQLAGDAGSAAVAAVYLRIAADNFVATGIVYACSGVFQGLGDTWPALGSTLTRLGLFIPGALWLARQANFSLSQLWYWSVATVTLQALLSLLLLRRHWRLRVTAARPLALPPGAGAV